MARRKSQTGKTALITGASSGIGEQIARIHAERGGNLVLVARREERLVALKEELEKAHGIKAEVLAADLSDEGAPDEIFEALRGTRVDYLINNAGFGGQGLFHERPWTEERSMIEVNILALSKLTHLFLPSFIQRKSGRILNVSSTASLVPGPLQATYFATKAFVTFLGNALSEELRGTGVTVTTLMPGATDTGFAAEAGMEKTSLFQSALSPRGVAEDGYNAMLRGKLNVISGVPFARRVQYAFIPFMPRRMALRAVRKAQEV